MRMKWYRAFNFLFTSVATGLAAAFLVLLLRPDLAGREAPPRQTGVARTRRRTGLVRRRGTARRTLRGQRICHQDHPRETAPTVRRPHLQTFFRRPGRPDPRVRRENSLGSGVIVDDNGYVLTNNHVIDAASEIHVVLDDGRSLPARVVGTDPETDIAVLQAAGSKFPVASLGRSEPMQVGDVVMAIGNPFGVGQTVTMGIVSATGRNQLGITDFENFIQTDAAINPGNSGGALINPLGEVVGINTAIFSESGGSHGIGFAIPIQLAEEVMRQIVEHGHVIRGWLGITGQDLTPVLAESLDIAFRDGELDRDGEADTV